MVHIIYSACTALAAMCYVAWQPRSLLITWVPASPAEVPLPASREVLTKLSLFGHLCVQTNGSMISSCHCIKAWPTCASAGGFAARAGVQRQRRLLRVPALDAGPQQVHSPCAVCATLVVALVQCSWTFMSPLYSSRPG